MAWPSARYKTAANGGSWVPADMNGVQDQYVRSAGIERDDLEQAITQQLGLTTTASGHGGVAVRRGKSIIATEESRTNVAYGLLTTPDRVQNVVLPADGLIVIGYHALWKEGAAGAARAAVFLGANQIQQGDDLTLTEAQTDSSNPGIYRTLATCSQGLNGQHPSTGTDELVVTTGQVLGSATGLGAGGLCVVHAAAGTYDVSVQFKSTSASVAVKNRKLWVWTIGF